MRNRMAGDFQGLLEQALQGDRGAREALLRHSLPEIRAFVRLRSDGLIRRKESESDLVQTICRQVLEHLPDYRGDTEASFKGWLSTMVLRKVIDRRRYYGAEKRDFAKEVAMPPDTASSLVDCYATVCTPSRHAIAEEEVRRIEKAFDLLPEDYREVLSLGCLAGLPHRDVAAEMKRSEPSVRKLLSRARARLAILLEEAG